jgi:hypothetical protein
MPELPSGTVTFCSTAIQSSARRLQVAGRLQVDCKPLSPPCIPCFGRQPQTANTHASRLTQSAITAKAKKLRYTPKRCSQRMSNRRKLPSHAKLRSMVYSQMTNSA